MGSEWVQLISTFGFPIVACVGMAWYIYKVQASFQKTIENNTLALTKIESLIEGLRNDNK